MDRGGDPAIQCAVEIAPLARRQARRQRQSHRLQHGADADRIDREKLADQRHGRLVGLVVSRALHRAFFGLEARVFEHGAGEHVLRFRVRRHAEARHVDADDAHAFDLLGQQVERHARGGGHAQIDDHDRVVVFGLGDLEDRFADVFEELAAHERFGIEGHVAHGAARAVEMRRESEAVDAAGRTRQDRGRAAHAQAHAQRAEGRAHRLRLVVGPARIVGEQPVQRFALACGARGVEHRLAAAVAARTRCGRCRHCGVGHRAYVPS
jgi:hypothetical protein